MNKYFIISDVHGFYNEMVEALEAAGFDIANKEHILIHCGDAIDRGPNSKGILELFNGLYAEGRAILIKGNHEFLMEEAIARGYFGTHDIHNGTSDTVTQLTGISDVELALETMAKNELWNTYVSNCINFYEKGKYVFVHGWVPIKTRVMGLIEIPEYRRSWRRATEGQWEAARWTNGMLMWSRGVKVPRKTVCCGHWHTSWGHANLHNDGKEWLKKVETYYIDPITGKQEPHVNFDIFYDKGIVALDACTAYSKKVNVLVLDEKDFK